MIDRLPEEVILANADPGDADGDGISGRAMMVNGLIGRFGHKGSVPSLADFCADALINEMGVTVNADLADFAVGVDTDSINDPEIPDEDFTDLVFFTSHLAPPPRTYPQDASLRARTYHSESSAIVNA